MFLSNNIVCIDSRLLNSSYDNGFSPAVATWYDNPKGGGTGGACGFDDKDMNAPPFNGLTAAGNQNLFKSGKGCGSCYEVKCTGNPLCSGNTVTVTITNECPGACNDDPFHFDLSGKAFGSLAKNGQDDKLRNLGRLDIQFQRVACHYKVGIEITIDKGSNPWYLALAVEYVNGDGDVGSMQLLPSNSGPISMQQSFGDTWKADLPSGAKGPYSIRLSTIESGQTILVKDAIPANWAPGQRFLSSDNVKA
ncbi:putative expansin-B2 [Andrographis paniculata]|uniref:putative expansin-B2 n=1 Tax=Andrographis paniculata TaxID=175694 RepID=UPI0021E72FDC|nr:putative expansin-B2 [Andrographis paniculata]